ncbi:elongation factor 1-delta-like isoform X2 [Lineus longissimus]|uniref:elongation factor 1-delta-like isoform X2 n=1 Tax=Lineus longissimus TaxID=88925 RepID=UPI00315DB9FD
MAAAPPMMQETVWFDQSKFEKAEAQYQEHLAQSKYGATNSPAAAQGASSTLVNEIALARQHIQSSLNTPVANMKKLSVSGAASVDHSNRIEKLEKENKDLRKMVDGLCNRIKKLEIQMGSANTSSKPAEQGSPDSDEGFEIIDKDEAKPAAKPAPAPADDDSDDDDLFGSDSDDEEEMAKMAEEAKKNKEEAIAKKKKAAPIGKSTIIFAIKGWDDETDFEKIEKHVRGIEHKGLRWGAEGKLEPVAYGVQKLLMNAIVVDEECGVDFLEEAIMEIGEDYIQSVDIVAFNKI